MGRFLPSYNAEALERRRQQAIKMIRAGKSQADVARGLRVTRAAVCIWWKKFRDEGSSSLKRKPRPGRPPRIDRRKLHRLPELLDRGATHYGFQNDQWTTKRVAEVIEQEFGVKYDRDHVSKILHSLGMSWQKPERRALERDEYAIKNWVWHTWPAIKKKPGASVRR